MILSAVRRRLPGVDAPSHRVNAKGLHAPMDGQNDCSNSEPNWVNVISCNLIWETWCIWKLVAAMPYSVLYDRTVNSEYFQIFWSFLKCPWRAVGFSETQRLVCTVVQLITLSLSANGKLQSRNQIITFSTCSKPLGSPLHYRTVTHSNRFCIISISTSFLFTA